MSEARSAFRSRGPWRPPYSTTANLKAVWRWASGGWSAG